MQQPLLEVKGLKKYFPIHGGVFAKKVGDVKAVDDISFTVNEGEILGIVGESGCGKSTTGKAILRLIEPTDGEVWFEGEELVTEGDMMLFNVKGQLMMHGVNRMNVVGLPAGVYMVRTANGVAKVILGR